MNSRYQILTAPGRGAIALIRVRGSLAVRLVDSVFHPHRGKPLVDTAPGRLRLGRMGLGVGDEVVSVRLDADVPTVEIQCHGGPAAVAAVVGALEAAGAVPGSGLETASEDRIRAQAIEDLAFAPTLRTASILLDQAHGALSQAIDRLSDQNAADPPSGPDSPLLDQIDGLIRRGEVGTRLRTGWWVAIAGRPNVGKSRLFNALAGFERSIVDPRAGVTRDVVTLRTAFGGWPVELADTAGDRESIEAIEQIGIRRARQHRRDAHLVLLVLDRSERLREIDRHLLETVPRALVVANKSDRPPAWDPPPCGDREFVPVSAETGEGLARLVGLLEHRLVPEPPEAGSAVPFRPEQVDALAAARVALANADREGFLQRLAGIAGPVPDRLHADPN